MASVHTDANGGEQLAFTSSTSAFQVQAGDQMSNALMGNFSAGAAGASMNTQVIGQATAAGSTSMAANAVYVKISGGGMSAPQTLTLNNGGATVDTMIDSLISQLTDATNQPTLAASGITAARDNGRVVFTNSKNEQFSVEVTGDTGNKLGFGAFQKGATATADYTSVVATGNYDATAKVNTTSGGAVNMEFSVGGGPAIAIGGLSLAGGDATGANLTSAAINTPVHVITGVNDHLTFDVGTNAAGAANHVAVTLSAAGTSGTETAGTAKFLNVGLTPSVVIADVAGAATAGTHKFAGGDGDVIVAVAPGQTAPGSVDLKATNVTVGRSDVRHQCGWRGAANGLHRARTLTRGHRPVWAGPTTSWRRSLRR